MAQVSGFQDTPAQQSVTRFTSDPLPVQHFLCNVSFYQWVVTYRTSLSGSSLPHKMFVGEHSREKILLFSYLEDSRISSLFWLAFLWAERLPSWGAQLCLLAKHQHLSWAHWPFPLRWRVEEDRKTLSWAPRSPFLLPTTLPHLRTALGELEYADKGRLGNRLPPYGYQGSSYPGWGKTVQVCLVGGAPTPL